MKEITKEFLESEVEIVAEQQQRKEIKLIGRQRKVRGHILWEFNQKTKELNPASYKKQDFNDEKDNKLFEFKKGTVNVTFK